MTITLVTTLWRRALLTRLFLDYYAALRPAGVDLRLVAVASLEDPSEHAIPEGWTLTHHPNAPLSDKWQHGVSLALKEEPDAVCIMGSDDFASARLFEYAAGRLSSGAAVITPRSLYFYHLRDGRCIYTRSVGVGAGRFFSAAALRAMGGRLWKSGWHQNLERCQNQLVSAAGLARENIPDIRAEGIALVDVKGAENMHSFRKMERNHDERSGRIDDRLSMEYVDGPALLRAHFPTIAGAIIDPVVTIAPGSPAVLWT